MTNTLEHPTPPQALSPDLRRLMTSFRMFQMQHARVLHRESVEHGLHATDVRFVFFLAASEGAGVTPKQAGEYLELSTGAMTSLIDRLCEKQYIERRPNPDDRRSVILQLTGAGQAVAREIGGRYVAAFAEVVDPEHQVALAEAFERVGAVLARQAVSSPAPVAATVAAA